MKQISVGQHSEFVSRSVLQGNEFYFPHESVVILCCSYKSDKLDLIPNSVAVEVPYLILLPSSSGNWESS